MTIANAPPIPSIRRLTVGEYEELPDWKNYELDDGLLVERTMGAKADFVTVGLITRLRTFIDERRLGWTFGSETGYQCFEGHPNRIRKPDGSFVRFGRLAGDEIPDGWIRIVPDLVFESVSPNDAAEMLETKLLQYQSAGIPIIWVLYPFARRAHVLFPNGSRMVLAEDDFLDGGEILPGFRVRLGDLFSPAKPVVEPPPSAQSR